MTIPKVQFTMRLEAEAHAKIKKIAKKENRAMINMIEHLVKKEIERHEAENGEIEVTEEDLGLK